MRAASLAMAALVIGLAGCSDKPAAPAAVPGAGTPEQALIGKAQALSDQIGGCARGANARRTSRVVTLESASIVMVACSENEFAYTDRLFAVGGDGGVRLLTLPDYDMDGWFSADQASMAELDAGSGTLTTLRRTQGKDNCGSEGRYTWNGAHFALQELRWQDCEDAVAKGPPFPVIWPSMPASAVDPSTSTPAP